MRKNQKLQILAFLKMFDIEISMKFKTKNLRAISEMVVGDAKYFRYRSSFYITEFFQDCGLDYTHDGSTRRRWAAEVLEQLLADSQFHENKLPERFMTVLQEMMDTNDATDDDPDRSLALASLNAVLLKEGFEAFYSEDGLFYVQHTGSKVLSNITNPHRRFTPDEIDRRDKLAQYLLECSEDDLIEEILLPLFRQLGFIRISAAGHKDKSLEYGKDIWMKFILPTRHSLYFGIQVKKGKLDASGKPKAKNINMSEIYNQTFMMLGHEIFDPETNKKSLVDHAFIIAGGEITKQAKNWLGGRLDATQRSQIMFMDRDDILNLFTAANIELPKKTQFDSFDVDYKIPF